MTGRVKIQSKYLLPFSDESKSDSYVTPKVHYIIQVHVTTPFPMLLTFPAFKRGHILSAVFIQSLSQFKLRNQPNKMPGEKFRKLYIFFNHFYLKKPFFGIDPGCTGCNCGKGCSNCQCKDCKCAGCKK